MKRWLSLWTGVAIGFAASPAHAWDGVCLPQRPPGDAIAVYTAAICKPLGAPPVECEGGLAAPRGVQLGEHALITHLAMVWAGLESHTRVPADGHYYNDNASVGGLDKLTPAGTGGMAKKVLFLRALPEYSEVPDISYSLTDFLMGNEECLPNHVRGATLKQNASCHSYKSHIAAVNSSHFAPQNKAMYEHYHAIALAIAARCKAMANARGQVDHPLIDEMAVQIASCEREALAVEAVASHYMADVWSIGHMWQRPGSPNFEPTTLGQYKQLAAGAVSGLIHGWRALARPFAADPDIEHDQLCMPGPYERFDPETKEVLEAKAVQWTYPVEFGGTSPIEFGAGDLYLLTCNARRKNSRWALAPENLGTDGRELELPIAQLQRERPLSAQYRRMLSCMAAGFEEVYNAGPKLDGEKSRTVPETSFESGIRSPTDRLCFGMRATNHAMYLGAGVSGETDFADPAVLARVRVRLNIPEVADVEAVRDRIGGANPILDTDFLLRIVARQWLVELGESFLERTNAAPNATDASSLSNLKDDIFDQKPNAAYVDLITNQKVNYIERKNPATWSALPDDLDSCFRSVPIGEPCDRLVEGEPARFCDPTAIDANGIAGPRCVAHEAAILRAFRPGEVGYHCRGDTKTALELQREKCRLSGDAASAACDACVEVILPHVRNACGRTQYPTGGMANGNDLRSECDIYRAFGLVDATAAQLDASSYYLQYMTSAEAAAQVRELCFADPATQPKEQCEEACGPPVPNCGFNCGDDPNFPCCRQAYCAEFENCPGECTDIRTDPQNCGCCGTVCPGGRSACCGGKCVDYESESPEFPGYVREQRCCEGPNGLEVCSTHFKGYSSNLGLDDQSDIRKKEDYCPDATGRRVLVDLANDSQNCGVCGYACPTGYTCCGTQCRDLTGNSLHCGSCYNACGGGMEGCCNGLCQEQEICLNCPCNPGYHCVPGFGCVLDGNPDPPLPMCSAPVSLACNLGYRCQNPAETPNCGACDGPCDRFGLCCNEACISINNNDPATCGCNGCGPNEFCRWNTCYPSGNTPAFTLCGGPYNYCQDFETCCGGRCVNTFSDERHCGICDQPCGAGLECCEGMCYAPAELPAPCR